MNEERQAKTLSHGPWLLIAGAVILLVTAIILMPLITDTIEAGSQKRKEEVETIKRALKRKEMRMPLPSGYTVDFDNENGVWRTSALVGDEDIKRLAAKEDVSAIEIRFSEITSRGFAYLKSEPITSISLFRPILTADTLKSISSLTTLRTLEIKSSKRVTDKTIAHLTGPGGLTELNLQDTRISDRTIEHLADTFPELKSLNLRGCKRITSKGIGKLGKLAQLSELALNNVPLDHQAIDRISRLRLSKLQIRATGITDSDILKLKDEQFIELTLSENGITDRSLPALASMKSLKFLNLRYCTNLTPTAVRRLINSLPDCHIRWKDSESKGAGKSKVEFES